MEQPEGGDTNTYGRGTSRRHAARLPGTAPPLRGRKVTTGPIRPLSHYPFADCPSLRPILRPQRADRRPLISRPARPRSSPPRSHTRTPHSHPLSDFGEPTTADPPPHAPSPLTTPQPQPHPPLAHTGQLRPSARKRKEKKGMRRPAGETPRLCNTPERGCHRRSCA